MLEEFVDQGCEAGGRRHIWVEEIRPPAALMLLLRLLLLLGLGLGLLGLLGLLILL
jgi:hypothetical protein